MPTSKTKTTTAQTEGRGFFRYEVPEHFEIPLIIEIVEFRNALRTFGSE